MCQSTRRDILPKGGRPCKERNYYEEHAAEYQMDIKVDKNLKKQHYHVKAIVGRPVTVFNTFLVKFVSTLQSKRRFGFARLFIHTEEYHQLLDNDIGDKDNLLGLCLGPNSLFNDALRVQDIQAKPLLWKKPIVRFTITFSESARLLWIREDVNGAFESGNDIQISGRHSYIPDLARK
nr:hypothetical protein [Tanacetum cinerariifolium]